LKVDNSSSAAMLYVRNDGHWGNAFTTLTDRWSDMRHSGTASTGYVRTFTKTDGGTLDGFLVYTAVQAGSNTTAIWALAGNTVTGVSTGLIAQGGTGNQSYGVNASGGISGQSVGVRGASGGGNGSYAAGVVGAATSATATVTYGVWGNNTSTAACNNYGGYFQSTSTNTGTNIGMYASASGSTNNYAIITGGGNSGFGLTAPTAFIHIVAGTTSAAQLRLAAGVAPSSPNDGDIWYENTNDRLMFHKNATSCEIISASAVTTEAVTSDTTLTITYNGTTYKLLAIA
jgi:hypothetical protein